MIAYFLAVLVGYLVGAIPSGFLIARACGVDDITQHGSGNIGATNVSRVLGKKFFFIVFLLDACKAFAVIYLVTKFLPDDYIAFLVTWFAVLFGNSYSIFLRGRGGKGVATVMGLLAATSPLVCAICTAVWWCVLAVAQNAGAASLSAVFIAPWCAYWLGYPASIVLVLFLTACWVWWRHYENIKQLVAIYRSRASSGA